MSGHIGHAPGRTLAALAFGALIAFAGCASAPTTSQDEMVKRILANIDIDKIAREAAASAIGEFTPVKHDNTVLWQSAAASLLAVDITGIRLVSPDRILLTLDDRNPFFVNADNGARAWEQKELRFDDRPPAAKGKAPAPKYPNAACVTVFRDTIVFRADGASGTRILAADAATGKARWSVEIPKSGTLDLVPLSGDGLLLSVRHEKRRAVLTAYELSTGAVAWKKEAGYGSGVSEPPPPVVAGGALYLFFDGVERRRAATGTVQWLRPEIVAGRQSPPMQLSGGRLHVLDGKNTLHVLDADSGKTLASGKQRERAAYTNISPAGDRVYLRGLEKGTSGEARFFVAAARSADAKELWSDAGAEPSVSNLVDEDGAVYFSTPSTLVAVDRESGRRLFAARGSDLGKSFPVRIAKYGNRVVYVGELVVAAFDAKTGAKVYRHGFDPVSQTAHMDALNELIESKSKWLSWFTGPWSDLDLKSLGFSGFFLQQASYSQNQATYHSQQALALRSKAFSSPLSAGAESAALQSDVHAINARISDSFSRAQASMGMAALTVENVQRGMAEATAADRAKLADLLRIRKLLYAAYVGTQRGDYVYRPTKEGGKVGISIVHLPSGEARFTGLTMEHKEVGVFCFVDFGKRVVYHPAAVKDGIVNGYFVARPANIPE